MANEQVQAMTVKSLLSRNDIKQRFFEIMREKSAGYTANLAVIVSNSQELQKCDPISIISCAVISASLDLPLDPNFGQAAIIPFKGVGTFQIMTKGFLQLAMRTGQYKTINATEVYEGQLVSENAITGEYEFNSNGKKSDKVIGYAAYFKFINGFEKTVYWSAEQVKKHGLKYSQTFKKGFGKWTDDFDAMAKKTVLKNLLSKWGVLSIEMQKAITFDQSKPSTFTEDAEPEYIDNEHVELNIEKTNFDKEKLRITEHIKTSTLEDLDLLENACAEFGLQDEIDKRRKELTAKNTRIK